MTNELGVRCLRKRFGETQQENWKALRHHGELVIQVIRLIGSILGLVLVLAEEIGDRGLIQLIQRRQFRVQQKKR